MFSPPSDPDAGESYKLSFRHSGMESVDGDVWFCETKIDRCSINHIRSETEGYDITHLKVEGTMPPNLHLFAPQLSQLHMIETVIDCNNSLSQLHRLEKLALHQCTFTSPLALNFLSSLRSLKALTLKQCGLTEVPSSLSELKGLEILDMKYNNFKTETFGIPPSLQSLKELDLTGCRLLHLPKGISQLRHIEILSFSRNRLGTSRSLGFLSSLLTLKHLNLVWNDLKAVPKSLSQLRNLEMLNISSNYITQPKSLEVLSSCQSLTELGLRRCSLETLPHSLRSLLQIRTLDLGYNNFVQLPPVVCILKNLETLDLFSNERLQTLDPKILDLANLKVVNIGACSSLPTAVTDLSNNGLEAIRAYYHHGAKPGRGDIAVDPTSASATVTEGQSSVSTSRDKATALVGNKRAPDRRSHTAPTSTSSSRRATRQRIETASPTNTTAIVNEGGSSIGTSRDKASDRGSHTASTSTSSSRRATRQQIETASPTNTTGRVPKKRTCHSQPELSTENPVSDRKKKRTRR